MADKDSLKKSPLHACHENLGARMVPFSGWLMPVQYSGIMAEHHAVRKTVGLFDISHMGLISITGAKSESWLNLLLTNDLRATAVGEGQYTLLLNEKGGVIDDLLIYRIGELQFFLVVNAAKHEEDLAWLNDHLTSGVEINDLADELAAVAIQGPKSVELIQKVFPQQTLLPRRNKIHHWEESDPPLWIARTGYTGEDGFELFIPQAAAVGVWERIMKRIGALDGLPAGLGARDTLRLEAGLPLNGNDLGPDITPLEAGLRAFVSFDKPEKFIGSARLREQAELGLPRKTMAFIIEGQAPPPRAGYPLFVKDRQIGILTSGAVSPTLGGGIGLALVEADEAKPDRSVQVDIRGKRYQGKLATKPLYRRNA